MNELVITAAITALDNNHIETNRLLFVAFVNCGRTWSTAVFAMEVGQITTLPAVIQLILENLLVFWELTLFRNLFQNLRNSVCVTT